MRSPSLSFLLGLAVTVACAQAAPVHVPEPSMDRWMYPFAGSGGTQSAIQTFGAVGNPDFDNRDGQMFLRFSTTGIAPAGLATSSYQLTALTLTLNLSSEDTVYDPTYDPLASYLSGGTDADAGRPVEVFGVGYRNGASAATWTENADFGNTAKGGRSAYAAGFNGSGQLIDVSNNVDSGFDVTPWAFGAVAGKSAGALLDSDTEMTFTFNLAAPNVLAYFQAALSQGFLDLMVTSLYGAVQPGTGPQTNFPVFYTKENLLHDPVDDPLAGRLSGDLTVVPEPGVLALVGLAALVFAVSRKRRDQ